MSTPSNRITFPVRGQAFTFSMCILNSTSGSLISGGLTGLTAVISKDFGTFVSTANAPVESPAGSGIVEIDLTANEMTCSGLNVYLTASNANAIPQVVEVRPLNLTPTNGRYENETLLFLEQLLLDLHDALYNKTTGGLTNQIYTTKGGSVKTSAVVSVDGLGNTVRGEMN